MYSVKISLKSLGIMFFTALLLTGGISSQTSAAHIYIGNNYEQQMPIPGIQLPSVRMITDTEVSPGETIDLSAYATVDTHNGGRAFFYWYAESGTFEYHPSYPDYSMVKFVVPDTSGSIKVSVQVGDTLGYIDTDSLTINVMDENSGDTPPEEPPSTDTQDCTFTPDPSDWQYEYHVAYRMEAGKTGDNKPTGHFLIQPTTGDHLWDYSGTIRVHVDGEAVNLFSDPDLQNNIGKSTIYHQGHEKINIWFDADFASDKEISIEHHEDRYGRWWADWTMEVSCSNPDTGDPNLTVEAPEVNPSQMNPGETIQLRVRIRNTGTTQAEASKVGYYLSRNGDTWDTSDLRLHQDDVGPLYPNMASFREPYVTLPGDMTPGEYHILFRADDEGDVEESNEDNNISAIFIEIMGVTEPDLASQKASVTPDRVTAGNSVNVSIRVRNIGNLGTPASSRVGYYLSTNGSEWDTSDTLLGTSAFGFLPPDQYQDFSRTFTIPHGTQGGTHYILFFADYAGIIPESDEENNITAYPIYVTPANPGGQDIVIENPSLESPMINSGENLDVSARVRNIGTERIRSTRIGYYISKDDIWDDSDIFEGDNPVGLLEPGACSDEEEGRLEMPLDTGQYFILFVADYEEVRLESNEKNNVFAFPIFVTAPDLTPENLTTSVSEVSAGSRLDVAVQVRNVGDGPMWRYTDSYFYLSVDDQLDSSDVSLGSIDVNQTAPNVAGYYQKTLRIPYDTAPRNYYLLFYADKYDDISESDEYNNIISHPIQVNPQNNRPVVEAGPDMAVKQGEIFTLSGSFTDSDAKDIHTVSIDWGNSTPLLLGSVNQESHTITASHAYTEAGTYTATVTINDGNGGIASDTLTITVSDSSEPSDSPPVADFTVINRNVCTGTPVTFTDSSANSPSAWSWLFPGATPNSSNEKNPKVVYDTLGTHPVTLTVESANGSDTETKTAYITAGSSEGGPAGPKWVWLKEAYGDMMRRQISDMFTDADGYSYITGYFTGELTFDSIT